MTSETKHKTTHGKEFKILTPTQMLVNADNTYDNLLNEIRQIMYSLYRARENTKKGYNNIINLINM